MVLMTLAVAAPGAGAADSPLRLDPGQLQLEPSFEACSFYFRPATGAPSPLAVEFRRTSEPNWRRAFDPVMDTPDGIWKGSLFNLEEDSAWEARVVTANGAEVIAPVAFRTWSSRPRIARTIDLSTLAVPASGLVISDQGSPDGWIKYTAPKSWRLERPYKAGDPASAAITFRSARYIILENVTIVGGHRHGVLVQESESVRILNCEISGWGRTGVQQFTNTDTRGKYVDANGETINYDGGIAIDRSARTVVERCYLHDPRHRANSWMFSHPAGPSAVYVNQTRGGTVLRWNDFVGSDEHRWNDVIEGRSNSAPDGGFFRDSDITGNFLAFGNDDGVELEGGGMNVRFYRNKIEGTLCGVSTGACILGPQFIHGNVITNPGDESGLALMFFKNSHGSEQSGKRHFINNTLVGPTCSAYGSYGKPAGQQRIGYMRNNIFVCNDARLPGDWARRDDFDYDHFWDANGGGARLIAGLRALGQEKHGSAVEPRFTDARRGDYHLAADSPLRGRAASVPNLVTANANPGALVDAAAEVPFRPLALVAAPRQLNFDAPARESRLQVKLSVPKTAREAVTFNIRKNAAFGWFSVEPAAGTVTPGETLTLTVSVDPTVLRGRPQFRGAFLVRTPSGLSRPVSVYAAADFREDLRPAAAPNSAYLAADSLPGLQSLVAVSAAAGVAGGKFVALAGSGSDPALVARFPLRKKSHYALLLRAAINDDIMRDRVFELLVDGVPAATKVSVHPSYQWNTGARDFRAVFLHDLGELAAGEHELKLRLLGGDLNVNELIVTDNPAAFFIDEWQRERI